MTPDFSIAMPTRGRVSYVERAIKSVLRQSLPNFELMILDNSQTPERQRILELSNVDPRIIFIDRGSIGVTEARKLGASMARGKLFALLDSDDYWEPNRLTKHLQVWKENHIGLSWDRWAEVSRGVISDVPEPFPGGVIKPKKLAKRLYRFNFIHASAGVVTSKFARDLGFPLTDIMSSDWTLFMRAAEYYPAYFIDERLSYKEIDSPSRVSNIESREFFRDETRVVRNWAFRHRPTIYGVEFAKKKTVSLLTRFRGARGKQMHEPRLMGALRSIRGELFVDVGSNRGQFSIPLSKNFRRVIAIEPNPNLSITGKNIQVLRYALSNKSGEAHLYLDKHPVNPNWTLDTILETFEYRPGHDPQVAQRISGSNSIQVSTTTLDEVLSGFKRVELVKIDVEGAEFLVLEGASESLAGRKIANIAIEVHNRDRRKEIEALLASYHYSLKWVDADHIIGKLETKAGEN